jgi:hypothetical protein
MGKHRIRELNDVFRQNFIGGRVVVRLAVRALTIELNAALLDRVRTFDQFTSDNDPHQEHDFGAIETTCFCDSIMGGTQQDGGPIGTTKHIYALSMGASTSGRTAGTSPKIAYRGAKSGRGKNSDSSQQAAPLH